MSIPAAYLGVILIWSTTPLAIKWSGEGPGFLFGVTSRMVVGALLSLLLLKLLRTELPWHQQARRTYLAASTGIFGAMLSVYWGVQFIPSGLISVLFGLSPIITGLMAGLWLAERSLTPIKAIGMVFGVMGLAIIFHADLGVGGDRLYGIAAVLLSVTLHSFSGVWVKRIGAGLPALTVTTGGLLAAIPLYLFTWLVFDGQWPDMIPWRAGLAIGYLGTFGSVLGFVLYFYILKQLPVSTAALITLITPVLALMLGHYLNAEDLTASLWIGTGCILFGLAIYQWGPALLRLGQRMLTRPT